MPAKVKKPQGTATLDLWVCYQQLKVAANECAVPIQQERRAQTPYKTSIVPAQLNESAQSHHPVPHFNAMHCLQTHPPVIAAQPVQTIPGCRSLNHQGQHRPQEVDVKSGQSSAHSAQTSPSNLTYQVNYSHSRFICQDCCLTSVYQCYAETALASLPIS